MFIHIFLNIRKNDTAKLKEINYIRVLGFSKTGREFMKTRKKEIDIPIITNYSDLDDSNLDFELHITYLYNMVTNQNKMNLIELKSIPIQKED